MDFFSDLFSWLGEHEATVAIVLAMLALLRSMWGEFQQLVSQVWKFKGWALIPKAYTRAKATYRKYQAKGLMQRRLEGLSVRIGINDFETSLGEDPRNSN